MESKAENIGAIIKNFFEDIKGNTKYIEKNLSKKEFYKLKDFLKHIEDIEHIKENYYNIIQEKQSEKIGNFLNSKDEKKGNVLNNKDIKLLREKNGIYFVISLKNIDVINEKFGYKEKGEYIPIEEKDKFKHFTKSHLKDKLDTVMRNNNHKNILYIGKADGEKNKLYDRIVKQYMGKKYNHAGGRAIWQIEGVEDFYITWIPTDDAKLIEGSLIQAYSCLLKKNKKENGEKIENPQIFYYPFANRRK